MQSRMPVLILFIVIYAVLSLYVMQRFSVTSNLVRSSTCCTLELPISEFTNKASEL